MKTTILTLIALAVPAISQDSAANVKAAMIKHWQVTGEFAIKVAEAMPAESYNYRPVPEEMSFGQVMVHLGAADVGTCAVVTGKQRPDESERIAAWRKDQKIDIEKETAVAFLKNVFNFCNQAIQSVTWEQLDAKVANTQLTGFERFWSYFTHTAHHRGQAEVYLRLKGIKPPTYVF